jgi:O-Antigen ligase
LRFRHPRAEAQTRSFVRLAANNENRMRQTISQPEYISQEASYWNFKLTLTEILLLCSAFILILTIHLEPILHSRYAFPLTVLLAVLCYLSPVSGFLFIACSQYLPYPEEASLNPSQLGFLVWLPVVLLRYSCVRLTGLWRLWPVLPCLIWYMLMTGDKIYLPENNYFKSLCYAVIACQLANEARGEYLKCLFGLCLGAVLIMSAYWCNQAGLPVELSDWGNSREGIARTGGTRADSVMVWPALSIGVSGLIGLQLALGLFLSPRPSPAWLTWLAAVLCVGSLPPLVATMTHAGIASLVLLSIGVLAVCVRIFWVGGFGQGRIRLVATLVVIAAVLAIAGYMNDAFSMRTKAGAIKDYYNEAAQESGTLASRNDVWIYSIRTILKYPAFGVVNSHEPEEIAPEYIDNPEGYVSHNLFLDYGRFTGIPGMILLALFFFYPARKMAFSSQWASYTPFLLVHLAMLIFWMSLSYIHYKTFWAFWMLAAMAAANGPKDIIPNGQAKRQAVREAIPPVPSRN